MWGSSLTSPVITHSRLLSSPQTLLSNRTGHGQLWHMPEQRMHYLQVSSHSSSKTWWSKCALLFLLEGKWTGGKETPQRGGGRAITNVNAANEHMGTCDIYTRRCPLSYTSSSDSHTVPSHCFIHWVEGINAMERVSTGLQKVKLITTHHEISSQCTVSKPTKNLNDLNVKFNLFEN